MSQLKKKCSVVMLPTEKATTIHRHRLASSYPLLQICKELTWQHELSTKTGDQENQHLYICSADGFNIGDWYIDNKLCKYIITPGIGYFKGKGTVIASTDSSLNLPTVSDAFIQKYITAYNAGTPIVDVMVEYNAFRECVLDICTCWDTADQSRCAHNTTMLKLRGSELIISRCKDSWSRDEVITLLKEFRHNLVTVRGEELDITDRFISQHL